MVCVCARLILISISERSLGYLSVFKFILEDQNLLLNTQRSRYLIHPFLTYYLTSSSDYQFCGTFT